MPRIRCCQHFGHESTSIVCAFCTQQLAHESNKFCICSMLLADAVCALAMLKMPATGQNGASLNSAQMKSHLAQEVEESRSLSCWPECLLILSIAGTSPPADCFHCFPNVAVRAGAQLASTNLSQLSCILRTTSSQDRQDTACFRIKGLFLSSRLVSCIRPAPLQAVTMASVCCSARTCMGCAGRCALHGYATGVSKLYCDHCLSCPGSMLYYTVVEHVSAGHKV